MRAHLLTWLAAMCLLGTAGCGGGGGSSPSPQPTGPTLTPGVGVGSLQIGRAYSQAIADFGAPAQALPSDGWDTVAALWPSRGIAASFEDANRNQVIDPSEVCSLIFVSGPSRAAAPRVASTGAAKRRCLGQVAEVLAHLTPAANTAPLAVHTAQGISPGISSRAQVQQAHGAPEETADESDWYWTDGIAFNYDEQSLVSLIVVFERFAGTSRPAVEPGTCIGSLHVGGPFSDAVRAYGAPAEVHASGTWVRASWTSKGLSASYEDTNGNSRPDSDERCTFVMAAAPFAGKTAEGIGVGTPRTTVVQSYGQPEEQTEVAEWYWRRGITLAYDNGTAMVLGVFAPKEPTEAAPPNDVEPGVRIGDVRVGSSLATIRSAYGPPGQAEAMSTDTGQAFNVATWPDLGLKAVSLDPNANGQWDAAETCDFAYAYPPYAGRTAQGVGIGSALTAVQGAYGAPEGASGAIRSYYSKGISFGCVGEEVIVLFVFRPVAPTLGQIVPGERIGGHSGGPGMVIGETYGNVVSRCGSPGEARATAEAIICYWESIHLEGTFTDADHDGTADPGETCSSVVAYPGYAGQTADGIGIGTLLSAVESLYGEAELTGYLHLFHGPLAVLRGYPSLGVYFGGDSETLEVSAISVFEPYEWVEPSEEALGTSSRARPRRATGRHAASRVPSAALADPQPVLRALGRVERPAPRSASAGRTALQAQLTAVLHRR